jgi:hypothetical protein
MPLPFSAPYTKAIAWCEITLPQPQACTSGDWLGSHDCLLRAAHWRGHMATCTCPTPLQASEPPGQQTLCCCVLQDRYHLPWRCRCVQTGDASPPFGAGMGPCLCPAPGKAAIRGQGWELMVTVAGAASLSPIRWFPPSAGRHLVTHGPAQGAHNLSTHMLRTDRGDGSSTLPTYASTTPAIGPGCS